LPNERFLSTAEALGEGVVTDLAELECWIRQLDLLVAKADLTEKHVLPMDSVAYSAFEKYEGEHRTENWLMLSRIDGKYFCIDDVPRLAGEEIYGAPVYPVIHMRLLGWWLAHAWRFIDLAETAIKSLDFWNVTTAALAARALIEEVGCLLYEADRLSKGWAEVKSSTSDNWRLSNVHELLHDRLIEFTYASRGIALEGETDQWAATNVMTYVQKLAKHCGEERFNDFYTILSNAAHPAFGAKNTYASHFPAHDSGAYSLRRLTRRPTASAQSAPLGFAIASTAAYVTTLLGGENCRPAQPKGLLYQALSLVDDFGLTTKSGLLTRTRYWRKLRPRSSRVDPCACGCGKWSTAEHRWGEPAPQIRVPRDRL
jgi:hypothetical protein